MSKIIHYLDKTFYPNHKDNWDDLAFQKLILARYVSGARVLDYGCGRGAIPLMSFAGHELEIYGADIDVAVFNNPNIKHALLIHQDKIPCPDDFFDIVFANNVMEHIEDPETAFAELSRVLKPGGYLLFKTPSKYAYVSIIAAITPMRFHALFASGRGRSSLDFFPTKYKINTKMSILKLLDKSGLRLCSFQYLDGRPEYLRFNPITYIVGIIYHSFTSSFPAFGFLRPCIICEAAKYNDKIARRATNQIVL